MELDRGIELFARDMVQSFYLSHIKRGLIFVPSKIYDRHIFPKNKNEIDKFTIDVKDELVKEYLTNTTIDINLDLIRLKGLKDIFNEFNKISNNFGFNNYLSYIEHSKRITHFSFKKIVVKLLEETKSNYFKLFNQYFKSERLNQKKFLENIRKMMENKDSFDLKNYGLLSKKIEKSKLKIEIKDVDIAFLSPLVIPFDVRAIVPAKISNYVDEMGILHEIGHGFGFAYTKNNILESLKRLGLSDLTEGYAFLFQHLIDSKLGVDKNIIKLYYLFSLRRNCSSYLYQLDKYTNKKEGHKIIEENLGIFEFEEELDSLYENGFNCVEMIKADLICGILTKHLEKSVGKNWYNLENGWQLLEKLMASGNSIPSEELLHKMGHSLYDINPIIEVLNEI